MLESASAPINQALVLLKQVNSSDQDVQKIYQLFNRCFLYNVGYGKELFLARGASHDVLLLDLATMLKLASKPSPFLAACDHKEAL